MVKSSWRKLKQGRRIAKSVGYSEQEGLQRPYYGSDIIRDLEEMRKAASWVFGGKHARQRKQSKNLMG